MNLDRHEQARLRSAILEAVNRIIAVEGGPVQVSEIRIVPAPTFFGLSHGTTILREDGNVAIRIAVDRAAHDVVDTILHETAHVLLGPEHIDQPDHGVQFQEIYDRLKRKYSTFTAEYL